MCFDFYLETCSIEIEVNTEKLRYTIHSHHLGLTLYIKLLIAVMDFFLLLLSSISLMICGIWIDIFGKQQHFVPMKWKSWTNGAHNLRTFLAHQNNLRHSRYEFPSSKWKCSTINARYAWILPRGNSFLVGIVFSRTDRKKNYSRSKKKRQCYALKSAKSRQIQ